MENFPSFDETMQIDNAIYQLASYDSSDGMIKIPGNSEETYEHQKKIADKFNYFKRLIQNGESSFSDIQKAVIMRSGPFSFNKHNLSTEQAVDKLIEDSKSNSKMNDSYLSKDEVRNNVANMLEDMFNSVITSATKKDHKPSDNAIPIENKVEKNGRKRQKKSRKSKKNP